MQIVVRHEYGLGNQLFQYAAGRYFAKKYAASLRFAVERPVRQFSHGHARPFLLSKFLIPVNFVQISTFETRPARSLLKMQIIREPKPQPHIFNRNLTIPEGTRRAYMVGMWQCYPPAQMVEEELRNELLFREQPKGKNLEVARGILATPNAVSLHIRRGDYALEFPESVLTPEYYLKAIAQIKERLPSPKFFLFSDDPRFAHQFASQNPSCTVIDHNGPQSAHEDLRLMSLCQHHIIANSTFSWWGAFLNPKKDKAVIVPRKWLKFETSDIEIALPGWSLL